MRRDQLPPQRNATYVLPRFKVAYVSVPKAACTSVKWLLADLQGEEGRRFHSSLSREPTRSTTIHRRALWRHTPMLHSLARDELRDVSPERGWFIFAVVRHPSARVWSAWQSKFLLREPLWVARFAAEPWFPRVPESTADVVEDFQRFVYSIGKNPGQAVMRDRHLRPQARLLTPERTPYTRIYQTGEIPELLEELTAHLRGAGWDGELSLRASNETPLRPLRSMFTQEVLAVIRAVYKEDLERFRYETLEPEKYEPSETYPEATLRGIRRLIECGERVGDLALRAQGLSRVRKKQRKEIRALRRRLEGRRGTASTPGAVTARGRWLAAAALRRPALLAGREADRSAQSDE